MTGIDVRSRVLQHLHATVVSYSAMPFPSAVDDAYPLRDLLLDSVAYASLLSGLDHELGCIPLGILSGTAFPETVGDLVAAYVAALDLPA